METLFAQFLTGLASASSLFLAASGLSLIFGVTRVVNFAHGAFYMIGAYVAVTLTRELMAVMPAGLGFWLGLFLAASVVAALGALVEVLLLRRLYGSPELFQLLATFGLTLAAEDLVVLVWGPQDLVGPSAPGLGGSLEVLGARVPAYDVALIAAGPMALLGLWLLLNRTRFGVLIRAAAEDRGMVAALGVDQRRLFTAVFALGVFLAALGGAMQLPRDAVSHVMGLSVVVEVFVVVVIGGLGSVPGAFVAALLVAQLNAFGILVVPSVSIVLPFLVMALVLAWRPHGLFGTPEKREDGYGSAHAVQGGPPWRPLGPTGRVMAVTAALACAALPAVVGEYALWVAAEVALFVVLGLTLQFLMSTGGMTSFGHAAYFGLGAYGAAFAALAGWPLPLALLAGLGLALAGAALFGWFCVRLSGVYMAMLTLAFAQIAWATAFQWVAVTGGDNGLLGVWPPAWASGAAAFYWLCLGLLLACLAVLRGLTFSPFGYALRATRDAPVRSEAIGLSRMPLQWAAFALAGGLAGLAGGLYAYLKGSVFPDVLAVPFSVDALVMVLLGGVGTVSGALLGAIAYKTGQIWLIAQTDMSKLILGAVIVFLVVLFPQGLGGALQRVRPRRLGAKNAHKPAAKQWVA